MNASGELQAKPYVVLLLDRYNKNMRPGLPCLTEDMFLHHLMEDPEGKPLHTKLDLLEDALLKAESRVQGPPTADWFDLGYGAPGTNRDGRDLPNDMQGAITRILREEGLDPEAPLGVFGWNSEETVAQALSARAAIWFSTTLEHARLGSFEEFVRREAAGILRMQKASTSKANLQIATGGYR